MELECSSLFHRPRFSANQDITHLCLDIHLMFSVLNQYTASDTCEFAATLYMFLYARPQDYDFLGSSHIPKKKKKLQKGELKKMKEL